ncbi:MAG: Dyp-type peroxidase [Dehalococcoidia bacterium]|nr:Dyp-type peroxidase [Dehalococcoidia bacterium]
MPGDRLELEDIQGIVARGYGGLPLAAFLLLGIPSGPGGRAWLAQVADEVTPADHRPDRTALHVAFTRQGLVNLGLPEGSIARFSHEFRDGMTSPHRQRILGDTGESAPEHWEWGGPGAPGVDAVLLLYAVDQAAMDTLLAQQTAAAEAHGLAVQTTPHTSPVLDREPFGFRDGISQPFIEGLGKKGPAVNTIRAGEFVLGYENEYGLLTDRPVVPADSDPTRLLPVVPGDTGARDFGRNGTYLVFRQLEQDVAGFWSHLDSLSRTASGEEDPGTREWLAAKMVGRWPGGASLVESPEHDDPALAHANDFGYHERDVDGLRCPVGAHVRRANPRDSLDPDPGTEASYELNKRHRLLRRGRPYGPPFDAERGHDGEKRGLHFICLSANIARQFEFVQQTWLGNPKFDGLYDSVDPLLGPRGPGGATYSIPRYPVRQRFTGLPSFVTVRGGAYFFLPGIRALRYLAAAG